jgi:succinate dehydrogenase/fumarate reductase-like Fe-S protein
LTEIAIKFLRKKEVVRSLEPEYQQWIKPLRAGKSYINTETKAGVMNQLIVSVFLFDFLPQT